MAKPPNPPKKPIKTPKSKAHRADIPPIGPALAELLNPAINRGEAGLGSSTNLKPPPDNSWDRRAGGEAASHRARASTPKGFTGDAQPRSTPLQPFPQPAGARRGEVPPSPTLPREGGGSASASASGSQRNPQGFGESPQREFAPAVYGTAATIPTLDPELAKQLGFTTEQEDAAALARPPRNKMEALGVQATADALEALVRDGRPEFKDDKIWVPHRPPRPEKSEGGQPFVINAKGATAGAPYIQRLRVNGKPSSSLWLDWAALSGGGVLNFEMGATANKSWGAAPQDAPPSYAEVP